MIVNENKVIITKDNIYKLKDKNLISVDLKEDNIFNKLVEIIILDEDIYIETIDIPTCKLKIIDNIIQNYIKEKFLNWDEMLINYVVVKNNSKKCKVKFYCVNSKELTKLRCREENIKIKKIRMFQSIMKQEGNKLIKEKQYVIYSLFKNKVYIMLVFNGIIMSQAVLNKDKYIFKNIKKYMDTVKTELKYLNAEKDINIWKIDFDFKFKPINLKRYKFMEDVCLDVEEKELFQIGIS